MRRLFYLLIFITVLTACDDGATISELPTVAAPEALGTATVLTRNAPPAGFRAVVNFPDVDRGLAVLPAWYYESTLAFEGTFAGTSRATGGSIYLRTWYNQIGQRRRVVVEQSGDLLGIDEEATRTLEGVRLAERVFLVEDNTCASQDTESAQITADLLAGDLIGGVTQATPSGDEPAVVNGERVWRYDFDAQNLNLPSVTFAEGGGLTGMTGELWISPEREAVVRYYVNLDMQNAFIFNSDAPVSGQLRLRFDLYDIGVDPNITRPFGC